MSEITLSKHRHGHSGGNSGPSSKCDDERCAAYRRGYEAARKRFSAGEGRQEATDEIRAIRGLNRWLTADRNRLRRELAELRARTVSVDAADAVATYRRRHPLEHAS